MFQAVVDLVTPVLAEGTTAKLSSFQKILVFLMKLKLNLLEDDLACRFNVSCSTVSKTFLKVLNAMAVRIARLIKWPDRETLKKTLPAHFR